MPDRQERYFRPDFDLPGYNRLSMKFEKEMRGALSEIAVPVRSSESPSAFLESKSKIIRLLLNK